MYNAYNTKYVKERIMVILCVGTISEKKNANKQFIISKIFSNINMMDLKGE